MSIADTELSLHIQPDIVVGIVNDSTPSDILEGYFNGLSTGLDLFFLVHDKGIITCETLISVAVMRLNNEYYLFDSHAWGPKDHNSNTNGSEIQIA